MVAEPILVADIGGTNARFALAERAGKAITLRQIRSFRAEDFRTIEDAARAYLGAVDVAPRTASFAVAGPVTADVITFTNSPWVLDIAKMRASFAFSRLQVVNDFEALASAIGLLPKSDLLSVKGGVGDPTAPIVVLGPGTGLGQALIVPSPNGQRIISTEGGHVGFAPCTDEEIAVMRIIARDHGRASLERLLSGPGLVNIHAALCALTGVSAGLHLAHDITEAAATRSDPIAARAMDLFCAVLGSAAGDAVLATGARGGVVLGGGILPKIRDTFLNSQFVPRFLDKGRMRSYVESTPVHLIIHEGTALLGAALRLDA